MEALMNWVVLAVSLALPLLPATAIREISQQPGSPALTLESPRAGDVVTDRLEVRLRASGLREDVQLLAADAENPRTYRWLGRVESPRDGATTTRLVDTRTLGAAPMLRLLAVSSNQMPVSADGLVDARAIPPGAVEDRIEVRHAAALTSPDEGARVGPVETIRAVGFLQGSYLAVVVRPINDGGYWVQNNGIAVVPAASLPVRTQFGGRGTYHLYVGVSYDATLFVEGDRLARLPTEDDAARPVFWVGPIEVTHP
jgi:hypothetical protein